MNVPRNALNAYRQTDVVASTAYADPHTLVAMLFDGLDSRIAVAKGALLRQDYAAKGTAVKQAVDIVNYLQTCLDLERGGELAANLDQLYAYMVEKLLVASAQRDPAHLDEIGRLLQQIKAAWANIAPPPENAAALDDLLSDL